MNQFKKFLVMSLGCIFLAIGVYFFKIPNGFATGGVSGIATILAKVSTITAGTWIWGLNFFLLLIGFIFLGKSTGVKTIYCSLFYSAIIYALEVFIPITRPLSNQPLLELIYAMTLTSLGSAMIFNSDSSSGGTDIIALIMKNYTKMNVGKSLLVADFIVAFSSFFVFDLQTGLFSLLGLFAKAFVVDAIIEDINICKYFIVITSKKDEITNFIMATLHHGVTGHGVVGEYTNSEKYMIHTVCKRMEAIKLRDRIKKIDPHAFIIITTSSEIIGRGFRNI